MLFIKNFLYFTYCSNPACGDSNLKESKNLNESLELVAEENKDHEKSKRKWIKIF